MKFVRESLEYKRRGVQVIEIQFYFCYYFDMPGQELGKILPIEVIEKLAKISKGVIDPGAKAVADFNDYDIEGEMKQSDENLQKLIEERRQNKTP